ncbi:MAG: hypothetical protein ACTSVI_05095 [Promethearchaeota archaeon]
MKLDHYLSLGIIIIQLTSILIIFDIIQLILMIVFSIFAILHALNIKSQTMTIFWFFTTLGQVAYSLFFAFQNIPDSQLSLPIVLVSIIRISSGILAVINVSLIMEFNE